MMPFAGYNTRSDVPVIATQIHEKAITAARSP
jgi:hypothetical protein